MLIGYDSPQAIQTPLRLLDDLASVQASLGRDPSSSFVRAAGRANDTMIVRSALNSAVRRWNREYFSEKGCKVFLVTGAMLDDLLGIPACELPSGKHDKASRWETYAREVKGSAISWDWEELRDLAEQSPRRSSQRSPMQSISSSGKGKGRAKPSFVDERLEAIAGLIEPLDSIDSASIADHSLNGEVARLPKSRQRFSLGRRSASTADSREPPDVAVLPYRDGLGSQVGGKGSGKERIARATCLWLIVLPLS